MSGHDLMTSRAAFRSLDGGGWPLRQLTLKISKPQEKLSTLISWEVYNLEPYLISRAHQSVEMPDTSTRSFIEA